MRLTARQWQKPAAKRRLLTACRFALRVSGAHPSKMHSLRFADDFRERYETRYETAWRYCDYEGLGIWFTSFSYSSNHSVSPRAPTDGRIVIPQETASGDKGDPEQCQINAPRASWQRSSFVIHLHSGVSFAAEQKQIRKASIWSRYWKRDVQRRAGMTGVFSTLFSDVSRSRFHGVVRRTQN